MQPKYETNAKKTKCNLNMQPMQQTNANKPKYATNAGRAGGTNAGRRAGGWADFGAHEIQHKTRAPEFLIRICF